jgi:pSer/pThr/pTyr-binding forkhead associated (FHA) protein
VTFETDPALRQGEFSCQASLVEGPTTSGKAWQAAPPQSEPPRDSEKDAELVMVERGKRVKTFSLAKDRVVIGRMADSDVVVSDPGVSRQHAEVRREDGEFVIADLGSTNGTMVNASSIGEHTLEEGDRITVGRTVLEFRRR